MKRMYTSALSTILLVFFVFNAEWSSAQSLFYHDTFTGGITTGGYSPIDNAGGTGTISLNIAQGSTIHKAFLLAGRHGNAPDITVTLNGMMFTFDASNQSSSTFDSPMYGGASGVHAVDVTSAIDPANNTYTLVIPNESGPGNRYNDFYLYVAYENASLSKISSAIYLNTSDIAATQTWNIQSPFAFKTTSDVGLSFFTGYLCNATGDGEIVHLNGNNLGEIGGADFNSGACGGPVGSFDYRNRTLQGLGDDVADATIAGADALCNINTLVANGASDFSLQFDHYNGVSTDNAIWAVVTVGEGAEVTPTSIANASTEEFLNVAPNPFIASTQIEFMIANPTQVQLQLSDMSGRLMQTLMNEKANSGLHHVALNRNELSAGVYFLELKTENGTLTKKLILQ